MVLLSHWLVPQWAPPPRWATVSERPLADHSVHGWWSGGCQAGSEVRGRSRPSPQGPPTHLVSGQQVIWGPREGLGGLCPTGLQSPRQGHPLAGPRPWGSNEWTSPSSLPLQPHGIGRLHGSPLWDLDPSFHYFGQPEEPEGQLGPGICFLATMDGSSGSGGLALRELPAETCLLLARTGPQRGKVVPGDMALSFQNGEFHWMEIYMKKVLTMTWPQEQKLWHQKCLSTTHTPLPHLTQKRALLRAFEEVGVFKTWSTISLRGPQYTFLCSRLWCFGIVWAFCALDTQLGFQ